MYDLLSATGIREGVNQRWSNIPDIKTMVVKDSLAAWRTIYFKCDNDSEGQVIIHSDELRPLYGDSALTFNDVFTQSTQAFNTVDVIPTLNAQVSQYSDAIRANYHAQPYDRQYGTNLPVEALNDALITRLAPKTDYSLYQKHCLTTVNGFLHMTDTDTLTGVIIHDATKTKRISNQNSIGIWSFLKVCELKKIPITKTMISPVMGDNDELPLYKALYITCPQSIVGKTVALSLGGYFTLLESQLYTVINDTTIKVTLDVGNVFLDRLYESRKHIDMSSLKLEVDTRNKSFLVLEDVYSDDTIKEYMTLSQSFIILFDSVSMYKTKTQVRNIQMPNKVIAYKEPKYPVVTGLGRMPEYWSVYEDGQWALSFADRDLAHRVYNTTTPDTYLSTTDSTRSVERARLSGTYMLEVGKDL